MQASGFRSQAIVIRPARWMIAENGCEPPSAIIAALSVTSRLLERDAGGQLGRQARGRVVQVDRDDLMALVDQLVDQKTSDVAGSAGDENRHALASLPTE